MLKVKGRQQVHASKKRERVTPFGKQERRREVMCMTHNDITTCCSICC